MKHLFWILLLLPFHIYGQDVINEEKKWNDLPLLILERSNSPRRVLSTDSVYNFLRTCSFGVELDQNIIFNLKPIRFEEITANYSLHLFNEGVRPIFYNFIQWIVDVKISNGKMSISHQEGYEDLELRAIVDICSAIWDSTTVYTSPIIDWDKNRIPDYWFTMEQYNKVDALTRKYTNSLFNQEITRKFNFMQISRPVFDKKYNYAMIIIREMNDEWQPYLYKRGVDGWELVVRK